MIVSARNSGFAAIALLALTALAFAAAPNVSVDAQVDKSEITVGDHIRYSITVKHDQRARVTIPSLSQKLGEFLIRNIETPKPKEENGQIADKVVYDLTTYLTGEVNVPAVTIAFTYKDDSGKDVTETVDTEPIKVQVRRVAPEDATDIRDIKAPVDIPIGWRYYAFWGGIFLAVIVVAGLGILYWKYWRPRAVERALMAPPRPAHEVALERLKQIEEMDLVAEGKFKEYYDLVTGVLREYLGARYTIDALEMTTVELMRGLAASLKDIELRSRIASVLEDGDMVKFAKYRPQAEKAVEAIIGARTIVESTTPVIFTIEQTENISEEPKAEQPAKEKVH